VLKDFFQTASRAIKLNFTKIIGKKKIILSQGLLRSRIPGEPGK
jgi:hypothetical protein